MKTASEIFSIGDAVSAVVKSVDVKGRKIRLSIKDTEVNPEAGRSVSQYLNNRENVGSSLGKALADLDVKLTDPNN